MITEDYVSFETAKLLKKRRFDENCRAMYSPQGDFRIIGKREMHDYLRNSNINEYFGDDRFVTAPTLQKAMKWLREIYNLHIITLPYAPIDRPPYHPGEADVVYIGQIFKGIIPIDEVGRSIIKLSPEEAYEAAIKYCLENLVKL